MVNIESETNFPNVNDILLTEGQRQLEFLASQWKGAMSRRNHEQSNLLFSAYTRLSAFLEARGSSREDINKLGQTSNQHYAFPNEDPLHGVGAILLSTFAAHWRWAKSIQNADQMNNVVASYHEIFEFLWSHGFRGNMFPDAELPEELMPSYYIDYWRSRGSL